jgi:type VI secretion system protein ImpH
MAGTDRRSARDLIDEIGKEGQRFGFFQAVRLLALADRRSGPAASIPRRLRFGTPMSLAFPPSEILDVAPQSGRTIAATGSSGQAESENGDADRQALLMTIGFMGLTGPSGVLPTSYTELLIERRNFHRDAAAHQFLDLFTHRAVSLFYEAWRKHRFYLAYEAGERDGFTRNVLDLVGVGLAPLQSRLQQEEGGIPDVFLTHFAGLLSQKPISASNLAALVRGYFGIDAEVEQFVGQWSEVPLAEQTCLGVQACPLGESAFAGERIWDRQNKICVKLGPLSRDEFTNFLPGQPGAIALTELVQFCVGQTLACDLELTLGKESVPPLRLGGEGDSAPRLGYSTWLQTRSLHAHRNDARFSLLT